MITNGYCTLAEAQHYLRADNVNPEDDAVLEDIVEQASRMIDQLTGRKFFATTATKLYDTPRGRELWLYDDLLTITTLTNGDASVIAAASYTLWPSNTTPKATIRLTIAGGLYWQNNVYGDSEAAISVAGTWGYSTTAPADIKGACRRRFGENNTTDSIVSPAGVVLTPNDVPGSVMAIIKNYRSVI
jgi:hypothetical protein